MTNGRWCLTLVLLAVLAALQLAGCASPQRAARARALADISMRLQQAYRWKDFAVVQALLPPAKTADFEQRFIEPGENLVIVDTELNGIDVPDPEAKTGTVTLTVSWYLLPAINVTTSKLKCSFRHEDGRWQMVKQEEAGKEGTGPLDIL